MYIYSIKDLDDGLRFFLWRAFQTPKERGIFFDELNYVIRHEHTKQELLETLSNYIKCKKDLEGSLFHTRIVQVVRNLYKQL